MISDWIPTLASVLAGVQDIEQVHTYDDLPATLVVFPCIVVMPYAGSQTYSAGGLNIAIHKVRITLYLTSQILPEAAGKCVPFIARIRAALAGNVTLDGLVAHLLPGEPFYEGPGSVPYADKSHIGINFNVEVKEREPNITVSA